MGAAESKDFFDSRLIFHRQKEVLDALRKGEIEDLRISHSFAADKIVTFGLDQGFLAEGVKSFSDPRKQIEVHINCTTASANSTTPSQRTLSVSGALHAQQCRSHHPTWIQLQSFRKWLQFSRKEKA